MSLEVEETSEKEVGEEKESVLRKRKRGKGRRPKIQKGKKNMTLTKYFSKKLHDPIFWQDLYSVNASLSVRHALKKKTISFRIFSQHGGGVFPNPKTFVNLPSIFLYAKFILRC